MGASTGAAAPAWDYIVVSGRGPEADILPWAGADRLVIAYSPLAQGTAHEFVRQPHNPP